MRMIDLYNPAALILFVLLCISAVIIYFRNYSLNKKAGDSAGGNAGSHDTAGASKGHLLFLILIIMIAAIGCFLRFYHLTELTGGIQQDEASIGYEAFCLSEYGIDRNGYIYPVYPVTWGSGGGSPLLIYLNVLTEKMIGHGVFSIRLIPALGGCLTILLFIILLYRLWGICTALAGSIVLSFSPWHIILSRWSLDSNLMPFAELAAVMLFIFGLRSRGRHSQSVFLYAAAAVSAICMYCYGSATAVIPVYLLLTCIYCLRRRMITWRHITISFIVFLVICVPLAVFYVINFFDLPEILLSRTSFPRFTSSHFGSVFIDFNGDIAKQLLDNLKSLLLTITVGEHSLDAMWNYVPGYAALYSFTFPVTILGTAVMCRRIFAHSSDDVSDAPMMFLFIAALLFSLVIRQDTNRQVIQFLPLIYMQVMGWQFLFRRRQVLMYTGLAAILPALILFCADYFGGYYTGIAGYNFMPGYGEAAEYAYEASLRLDAEHPGDEDKPYSSVPIYSTYRDLASPFMIALYYCRYDPRVFLETVHYKDPDAEFRVADSFGEFVFGLPDEDLSADIYRDAVLILANEECSGLPEGVYELTAFRDYTVAVPLD